MAGKPARRSAFNAKARRIMEQQRRNTNLRKRAMKDADSGMLEVSEELDVIYETLLDTLKEMGQEGLEKDPERATAIAKLANAIDTLKSATIKKDISLTELSAALQQQQILTTELLKNYSDTNISSKANEHIIKQYSEAFTNKAEEAFYRKAKSANAITGHVARSGAINKLAMGLSTALLGPMGRDVADLFHVEQRLENLLEKGLLHKHRKAKRGAIKSANDFLNKTTESAKYASNYGADITDTTTLGGGEKARQQRQIEILADNTEDFRRQDLKKNDDLLDAVRDVSHKQEGSSNIFRSMLGFLSPKGWIAGLLTRLPNMLGSLLSGGGKFLASGASMAAKGAMTVGRGAASLLATPAGAVAASGLAGYAAGSYLVHNTQFGQDMEQHMSDDMTGISSGVGKAWGATKKFFGASPTVAEAIMNASRKTGVDYGMLMAFAKQESGFNPNAKAKTSSAMGLFQFTKGTWSDMVKKYGKDFGIGINDIGDPQANAIMGALYLQTNAAFLKQKGIPVNGTTLYAAHMLGPGGAEKLFLANPSSDASQLLPQAAAANPGIFKANGQSKSVGAVIDTLFNKVGKNADAFAAMANSGMSTGIASTGTAASLPGTSVSRSNLPNPSPNVSVTTPSSGQSVAQVTPKPKYGIDDIPMFVDDVGLVVVSSGGIT